jgi:hypothetical protein
MANFLTLVIQKFFYLLSFIFSIILLVFPYFLRRSRLTHPQFTRFYYISVFFLILIFILYAVFISILQYNYWRNNAILRYALPPYTPLFDFYLGYTYHQHFKLVIWRVIGAVIIIVLMRLLDWLFKKSLFYREEYSLLLLLSILIDFPLNIFFFFTGLIGVLVLHFYSIIKSNKNPVLTKASFAKAWVYLVPIFILLNLKLQQTVWWLKFKP